MDAYIYYRVRSEHGPQFQARARAMQAELSKNHGIVAELKRRPEAKDGRHTWMEIYHAIPDDFSAILAQALTATRLDLLIDGERHTEYFLDASSCA